MLGHPHRLAVFRLLMRRHPDCVSAGELAYALDLKASTLSAYLAALVRSGLVTKDRDGTSLLYGIGMSEVRHTLDYLLRDCCRGRPELCTMDVRPVPIEAPGTPDRKYKVLFICSGNSARSIFAESILRAEAGTLFDAYSAGTMPASAPNRMAVEILRRHGHDVSALRSKNISEFQDPEAPQFDFVFTVCDEAANEECPAWQGQPVSAHWGMPDPVRAEGTDARKSLFFRETYDALRNRILAFAALPIDTLDRMALQRAVDEIGREKVGAST